MRRAVEILRDMELFSCSEQDFAPFRAIPTSSNVTIPLRGGVEPCGGAMMDTSREFAAT